MALRIVGGRLSGRRFRGPGKNAKNTRPTAERVREAVFSALEARGRVDGTRVLDLFSGTGALAFEALSRGAESALAVDLDRKCVTTIRADAASLGLEGLATAAIDLLTAPGRVAERLGPRGPFDLVFVDPPYREAAEAPALLEHLTAKGIIDREGLIVFEHAARDELTFPATLGVVASYRYGDTAVAFLSPAEAETT
ncbi:MAG: 16S rRNA (guanine(966)-N(2))-methyltransferase RsmD [Deltaproteobacteria bacterium]|nr:16S rRNA (guanine(966)-N(2))-methyltransferase RsmD [Deltaproteobacteria bacterium]